jgi:hypothetical protein
MANVEMYTRARAALGERGLDPYMGNVGFIGMPGVGKSTTVNGVLKWFGSPLRGRHLSGNDTCLPSIDYCIVLFAAPCQGWVVLFYTVL